MERLVSKDQLAQATKLKSRNPLVGILYRISGIGKVNRFYDSIHHLEGKAFIDRSLELLDLKVEVEESDLQHLPSEGAFITVSNHPYGAIDGIALIQLIHRKRADFKVIANFLLQRIEQMTSFLLSVNTFGESREGKSSVKGIKEAMRHLEAGHPIGIFPAGEVSTYRKDVRSITDGPWLAQSIKIIQKAGVPVVPVYFDGANSPLFHLLGVIHPALRTLRLPAELMNKKGKTLRVRIGKPIPAAELASFENTEQLGRYLRAKTYALGSRLEVRKEYFSPLKFPQKAKAIIAAVEQSLLEADIDALEPKHLLFKQKEFVCYLAPAPRIPNLLREIGRLREHTFRAVGEGSNKAIDLDEYDLYYHHLFLWDESKKCMVGAYRIGKGREIYRRFRHRGFYVNSLFKLSGEMRELLPQTVELGRSFIVSDYQKHRLPLFLLWKGILSVLFTEPDARYVIGPVTISGSYQKLSKSLIIGFIEKYHYHPHLSQFVKPRKPYHVNDKIIDSEALLKATENDLKKLDRLIQEIEPSSYTVPVLLKKYLHQNASILGFNLDPKFNNALDGLMLLDMHQLPADTIENLQREFGTSS